MLIHHEDYEKEMPDEMYHLDGAIFRYCSFKNMILEGGGIDAIIISCEFNNLDWYWGIFNGCLFIDTIFNNCTFRGVGFPGCRFLNCKLNCCKFKPDNFGQECDFGDNTILFDTELIELSGFPDTVKIVNSNILSRLG